MKTPLTFFVIIAGFFGTSASAGYKVRLSAELNQQPKTTLTASVLESGHVVSLSQNLHFLTPMGATHPSGHFKIQLKSARMTRTKRLVAVIETTVWDHSGLPTHSPRFRSKFSAVQQFGVGQGQGLQFTQGDASVENGWTDYTLTLRLDQIEPCEDTTTCLAP